MIPLPIEQSAFLPGINSSAFQSEGFPDELNLAKDIAFRQPPHLSFLDHMQNLVALNRPPCSIERSKALAGIHPPLDRSIVLFHSSPKTSQTLPPRASWLHSRTTVYSRTEAKSWCLPAAYLVIRSSHAATIPRLRGASGIRKRKERRDLCRCRPL